MWERGERFNIFDLKTVDTLISVFVSLGSSLWWEFDWFEDKMLPKLTGRRNILVQALRPTCASCASMLIEQNMRYMDNTEVISIVFNHVYTERCSLKYEVGIFDAPRQPSDPRKEPMSVHSYMRLMLMPFFLHRKSTLNRSRAIWTWTLGTSERKDPGKGIDQSRSVSVRCLPRIMLRIREDCHWQRDATQVFLPTAFLLFFWIDTSAHVHVKVHFQRNKASHTRTVRRRLSSSQSTWFGRRGSDQLIRIQFSPLVFESSNQPRCFSLSWSAALHDTSFSHVENSGVDENGCDCTDGIGVGTSCCDSRGDLCCPRMDEESSSWWVV